MPVIRPQHLRGIFPAPSTLSLAQISLRPSIQSNIIIINNNNNTTTTKNTRAASTKPTPKPSQIPPPTPFIPDVPTFLTVIGRGLKQHASKIPDWDSLFTLSSEELRELGVEPPRARKYLLRWRQRFREGQYGVGGDLRHVEDGVAHLRILEAEPGAFGGGPAETPRRFVVNTPSGRAAKDCSPAELSRVRGYRVKGARTIVGPYALPLSGKKGAKLAVTEGMWEDRQGHKIDGGERRRTEVRYKRRIAERREARERGELY